ncbi:hypothetical protein RclHR1_00950008 [Rhizophagus clarus]|uniref:F-box domain-containing protein n=1 Tax=Rhizophagus clarus TaxID=94130 RepID=A0A2Z6S6R1_9GLOM|nr:hypothetical protein RclHR1_00950008 [Rhizophagus clarus]GES74660.1 hypothetical protein GLOIN_2v1784405 [Rhizophagus clarus]
MSQLPIDCLNDIFECLEDDIFTLHSCMFVNRLWCNASVRIFWSNSCNYSISSINTLVACLSNESKEILYNEGITNTTPTSTTFPIFNYASFCKILSISHIYSKVEEFLNNQKMISSSNAFINNNAIIVVQEMCKMFFNQISSLKGLSLLEYESKPIPTFTLYPGAMDCLKNLKELRCNSYLSSEIFYQLSKICHNISLLYMDYYYPHFISDGLADLISVQKNLKHFIMIQDYGVKNISSLITKLPNTLIKLSLYDFNYMSLLFIAKFSNLQELELSFNYNGDFIDFEKLSHVRFLQLQILKLRPALPSNELLIRFLENNGKNLKALYIGEGSGDNNSLYLAIFKYCINLRKFSARFKINELEMLKIVLKSCIYLKSIEVCCGGGLLSEKEALEVIDKYSHENISEIILYHQYYVQSKNLLPKELESFFINWANSITRKSLSLVIVTNDYRKGSLDKNEENMKIINKYIELSVIKNFKVKDFGYENYFDYY